MCSTFLDKMENANLTCLPLLSPSRPALVERALLCLVKRYRENRAQLSRLTETGLSLHKSEDLESRLRSGKKIVKSTNERDTQFACSLEFIGSSIIYENFLTCVTILEIHIGK